MTYAEKTKRKRTFRLQINRVNHTADPNKGVYVPILTDERIVIEFQCDPRTIPTITNLMELMPNVMELMPNE